MELREFIKTALLDITQGVKDAQDEVANGAAIAPAKGGGFSFIGKGVSQHIDISEGTISVVDFQIALTESAETENKKGIGVLLKAVGAGISKTGVEGNTTITTISFSVPVRLPASR
jgi:hypothetical protein